MARVHLVNSPGKIPMGVYAEAIARMQSAKNHNKAVDPQPKAPRVTGEAAVRASQVAQPSGAVGIDVGKVERRVHTGKRFS